MASAGWDGSAQTLRKVCELINRLEGPLLIGAVAATVHLGTQLVLADSPQRCTMYCKTRWEASVQLAWQSFCKMTWGARAPEALEQAVELSGAENLDVILSTVATRLRDK